MIKQQPKASVFMTDFDELFNQLGWGNPETPKSDFEIELGLAGLSKDDVIVQVNGNQLTISNIKKDLTGYTKSFDKLTKNYLIGSQYDLQNVHASMVNGLLTVKVPLKECAKNKPFQITVN